ncbi:MAG: ABC transporter permease [Oscillibacter sp.]|nr:ABC transporter permease [Oscillibacter sp.]
MKRGLYARLAWTGMVKNKRLYLPYGLSAAGMVLMFYILTGLSGSLVLEHMSGGGSSAIILRLGTVVIAVFALIFLFYTHSFLIRRREREFGLYNVLGMGKGSIARILLWETAITYGLTTGTGLLLGVVLYKLAELGMVRLLRVPVTYTLTVSVSSLLAAAALFAVIHTLILLNSLRQLHGVSAVALLRSESVGEKPPRAQWVLTAAGVVLLGGAYALAVSIKEPLAALLWFFAAVIMVILATYLLFISGSVTLCRGLQRNKKYYYRPQHFVSVASMTYRMKRNGAGLASVCILATMVLVMISSTTCLYVGQEDAVNARYPRDMDVAVYGGEHLLDAADMEKLREGVESTVFNFGGHTSNTAEYRELSVSGLLDGGDLIVDAAGASAADSTRVTQLHFLPLEDYNAATGQSLTLNDGQVYVAALRTEFHSDTLSIDGGMTRHVMKREIPALDGAAVADITPSLTVVVPDFEQFVPELQSYLKNKYGWYLTATWHYAFDTDLPENQQGNIDGVTPNLKDALDDYLSGVSSDWGVGVSVESKAGNRADFYGTYGGLFFLGIMLSIVFIFAAVAILYYKQLSEGYEDQSRFDIMQKVGMTKGDIRRSINSQLLTVFYLPLLMAGLHLCFAFPFIHKLLMLFNLDNRGLLVGTTAVSFAVFAALYALVYKLTGNAYYHIVADNKE